MTIIWHLEMRSPEQLNARPLNHSNAQLMEARVKQGELNRFLYQLIGQHWEWLDKNRWSLEQWRNHAERDSVRTWILLVDGSPAGYYELERQPGNQVEILYFGLAKPFIGLKLGGALLSEAVRSAWAWHNEAGEAPERVWVHTCSDDHPGALANYQARGFEVFKTEEE
ncbi:MAG: GNAT family N-acetyltransferase [Saccharospirillum sp.]|nr:GNAT family N-acetyltransferase [Saccharospirillum sp.]